MPKSLTGPDLAPVSLFATLSDVERDEVALMMHPENVEDGELVVGKGDLSYKLLVILEGSAQVERDAVPIATLGPGDYFGETGIIRAEHRNADVRALTPLRVGVLVGWEVRDLIDRYPGVKAHIDAAVTERTDH